MRGGNTAWHLLFRAAQQLYELCTTQSLCVYGVLLLYFLLNCFKNNFLPRRGNNAPPIMQSLQTLSSVRTFSVKVLA